MGFVEILLIGVGLSMDAFAVAVCKGLSMTKVNIKQTLIIAAFFGGFQALMPFLGWALGSTFADKIKKVDHWIAFGLLLYIGINMIVEAVKERNDKNKFEQDSPIDYKELTMMAVATSIDARYRRHLLIPFGEHRRSLHNHRSHHFHPLRHRRLHRQSLRHEIPHLGPNRRGNYINYFGN